MGPAPPTHSLITLHATLPRTLTNSRAAVLSARDSPVLIPNTARERFGSNHRLLGCKCRYRLCRGRDRPGSASGKLQTPIDVDRRGPVGPGTRQPSASLGGHRVFAQSLPAHASWFRLFHALLVHCVSIVLATWHVRRDTRDGRICAEKRRGSFPFSGRRSSFWTGGETLGTSVAGTGDAGVEARRDRCKRLSRP